MIMRKVYYILLCCVWLGQVACQDKGTEVGGQGRIRPVYNGPGHK